MRYLLLTSTILLAPALADASPQCTIPAGTWDAQAGVPPPALRVAAAGDGVAAPRTAQTVPADPEVGVPPALKHVAASGAQISELSSSHGLRSVVARNGQQFMILHVVPDGSAVVAGIISEMTPAQLLATAAGRVKELGMSHGLRGIFVSNGSQFQVFYVTPDGERVIPGAMWDATGHNVTRDQVTPIEGTVATVEVGPGAKGAPIDAAGAPSTSLLSAVEKTSSGTFGDPPAPKLYMFVDPMCSFSVRAMQQLKPLVDAKRLQVAVIPLAILDHEDGGRSTATALSMLSMAADQMVPAWAAGRLDGPASPEAPVRLAGNRIASELVGLRGTPTLIWRKADGTEGRSDGMPADLNALVASMAR